MGPWRLLACLKKNTRLTSIDLSENNISADAVIAMVFALEKNTTLTSINLSCNDIDAEAVMAIAFCH